MASKRTQDDTQDLASAKTNTMSPLLNMPEELVDKIVRRLEFRYLPQVRQVCRSLNRITFPYFARVFFDNQVFLLSDPIAMGVLHEISKREDLVKHVEIIRFASLIFPDEPEYGFRPYWDPVSWAGSTEMPELRWPCEMNEIADSELFNSEQLEHLEHKFLRHHLFDLLVAIFSNLKRYNARPSILGTFQRYEPFFPEQFPIRGLERLRRVAREGMLRQSDYGLYTVPLYRALVECGYATDKLELGYVQSDIQLSLFSYLPQRFPAENLRVLRLGNTLSDDHYGDPLDECPIRKRQVASLITVIAKARHLRELRLKQSFSPNDILPDPACDLLRNVFLALATQLHMDGTVLDIPCEGAVAPKLEILDLEFHVVPRELFVAFCSDRRKTLKKIRLDNVTTYGMFDNESMKDFIIRDIGGDQDSVIMKRCCEIDE